MGKASKWFKGLFLNKKPPTTKPPPLASSSSCSQSHKPPKKKWSFIKPIDQNSRGIDIITIDPNTQAISAASASAAAEVAVAAAQSAADVVRFTSSGRYTNTTTTIMCNNEMFEWKDDVSSTWHVNGGPVSYCRRQDWAAIKIQSHFRAYLAKRALRALKALVKIQALVRGHIVRRRTTDNIRRVQALLRVQARALARRSLNFGSSNIDNKDTHTGPPTPEKSEHLVKAKSMAFDGSMMLKRNGTRSDGKALTHQDRTNVHEQGYIVKHRPREDERSDKILQVDPGIYRTPPKHRNVFHSSHLSLCSDQYSQSFTTSKESTAHQTALSPSMYDVQSLYQFKLTQDLGDGSYFTADSSPQFYSSTSRDASSRRGPFTPTKSDSSKSGHSGYSDQRSYMSLTESSRAKMRSLSAPRQRPQFERSSSAKRYSTPTHHIDSRLNPQRGSGLHVNFGNKVYPGSGYLDRIGMPTM